MDNYILAIFFTGVWSYTVNSSHHIYFFVPDEM